MVSSNRREVHLIARQRSEVAVLYWSEYTGWFYRAQSLSANRPGSSPSRWNREEVIALAFENGFGAVRMPDGTMLKRTQA